MQMIPSQSLDKSQHAPEAGQPQSGEPLLNPFVLPAETDGRFQMLIIGTLMLTTYTSIVLVVLMTFIGNGVFMEDMFWSLRSVGVTAQIVGDRWIFDLSNQEINVLSWNAVVINLNAIITGVPRLILLVGFFAILIGVSYILYRLHAAWLYHRLSLHPVDRYSNTEHVDIVKASIDGIAADVGVVPPLIVLRESDYNDGQVFGFRNRYVLCLNARLLSPKHELIADVFRRCRKTDFRAFVLHELAHIVNGDIGRNYYARALWASFLAVVIVPLIPAIACVNVFGALQGIQRGTIDVATLLRVTGQTLVTIAQVVALVIVVRVIVGSLLRIREFYADWRVLLWGSGAPLISLLGKAQDTHTPQVRGGQARLPAWTRPAATRLTEWWIGLWRYHTPREQRIARLQDPTLLFRISPDLPLLTGVLLSFLMIGLPILFVYVSFPLLNVEEMITWGLIAITMQLPPPINRLVYALLLIFPRIIAPIVLLMASLVLLVYPVVGSLGRQVQRKAIVDLLPKSRAGWGYVALWKPAALLVVGVELGLWLVPMTLGVVHNRVELLFIPIWLVVFTVLTWCWLIYVRALTRILIGSHTGARPPRGKSRIVTFCSIVMLWIVLVPVFFARVTIFIAWGLINLPTHLFPSDFPLQNMPFMFGFTLYMLFTVSIILCVCWAMFSLGLALLWRWLRRARCPSCGHPLPDMIVVGRACPACCQPLAAWLYAHVRRDV